MTKTILTLDTQSWAIKGDDGQRMTLTQAKDLYCKGQAKAGNRAFLWLVQVGFELQYVKDIYRGSDKDPTIKHDEEDPEVY